MSGVRRRQKEIFFLQIFEFQLCSYEASMGPFDISSSLCAISIWKSWNPLEKKKSCLSVSNPGPLRAKHQLYPLARRSCQRCLDKPMCLASYLHLLILSLLLIVMSTTVARDAAAVWWCGERWLLLLCWLHPTSFKAFRKNVSSWNGKCVLESRKINNLSIEKCRRDADAMQPMQNGRQFIHSFNGFVQFSMENESVRLDRGSKTMR